MHKKTFSIVIGFCLSLLLTVSGTNAQGIFDDDGDNPLLDALTIIPDTSASRTGELYYTDISAIQQAYPGATMPADLAAFEAADDAETPDDPFFAEQVWWRIFRNISSGPQSMQMLAVASLQGEDVSGMIGFDLFQTTQLVGYGRPPENATVLYGDFDNDAIRAAYSDLGFAQADADDADLWCGPDGCESGTQVDPAGRLPSNPFGGNLGRKQPMVIGEGYLMSSAVLPMVEAHIAAVNGEAPMLAEDDRYIAAAEAITQYGPVMQVTILDGEGVLQLQNQPLVPPSTMLDEDAVTTLRERLTENLESYEALPGYNLLIFADTASEDEQIALLGLVYEDLEDAERAAEIIPARLATATSFFIRDLWSEIFAERRLTPTTTVYESGSGQAVMLLELRTPKATTEEIIEVTTVSLTGSDLELAAPGIAYRILFNALVQSDLSWLSTANTADLQAAIDG
jgi:hypothetical protein